ncbi:hypothetical protein BDK51DRAFT_17965, partial [Blyttiomyces helicus]
PPTAKRVPTKTLVQNVSVPDDYSWLRNGSADPDVATYIAAENAYTDAVLADATGLITTLVGDLAEWSNRAAGPAISATRDGLSGPCGAVEPGVNTFWEAGSYFYWIRYVQGKQYPVYMRAPVGTSPAAGAGCGCIVPPAGTEQVVLDLNAVVPENASYFYQGAFEVSLEDESLLAYSIDLVGSEEYVLYVVNITTGETIGPADGIRNTYYSVRWAVDQSTGARWVYYNVVDPVWGIPRWVYRFCVVECASPAHAQKRGARRGADALPRHGEELVYVEADVSLTTEVATTTDNSFLYIKIAGQITSEIRILYGPTGQFNPIVPLFTRSNGTNYDIEHHNGSFIVRTNAGSSENFEVLLVPTEAALASSPPIPIIDLATFATTTTGISHSAYQYIERIEAFSEHLVAWVRVDGLREVVTTPLPMQPSPVDSLRRLRFQDPANPRTQVYSVLPGTISDMEARLNRRFNTTCLIYTNSSLLRPPAVYALDMRTGTSTPLVPERPVPGLDPNVYFEGRVWANARQQPTDPGSSPVRIPISLVYQTGETGPLPTLLIAYGAYGDFQDPAFSSDIFPLLSRGLLYAICHPRGDADLGAQWYRQGKFERKWNTFSDVRDCLHGLVDMGLAARGRIAVKGRSAGGLVAGNVALRWGFVDGIEDRMGEDSLASVVIAQVPFVDPVLDMIDETVPWVPYEWHEWGNPTTSKAVFDAMMSYSPYHGLNASVAFPAVMVIAGMEDPRVQYWEPAKFVARMRAVKTNEGGQLFGAWVDGMDGAGIGDGGTALVLRVTDSGHFDSEGDFARFGRVAEWYGFVLRGVGVVA